MQDFANLTAELIAGRRSAEVQMDPVRLGVKMERPDYFEGGKLQDVVVRGRITGPYADEFLLLVRSHTLSETWRHSRPQRQAYNQRSQQKQGARFTRVHIYNQM